MKVDYREPYPQWIIVGMDFLAAGILIASFRDAWSVVSSLGQGAAETHPSWSHAVVAGAVVLAIDASILLLEQTRSQMKLRGQSILHNDLWVAVLILVSAALNVRYLTSHGEMIDRILGGVLGVVIPTTIAVLGYLKGEMLAFNTRCRLDKQHEANRESAAAATAAVSRAAFEPPADASVALAMASRGGSLLKNAEPEEEDELAEPARVPSSYPADAPRFRLHAARG